MWGREGGDVADTRGGGGEPKCGAGKGGTWLTPKGEVGSQKSYRPHPWSLGLDQNTPPNIAHNALTTS